MPTDKKISELPVASAINAGDVSVLVDAGTDYQYSFTQLLQFLEANLVIGAKITFGTVLPQNTDGSNNDVFINTAAGSFAQKIAGTWTVVYTLPPANAADGTMLYGAGTPSPANGKNLDSYIDTITGIFYYKSAGAWAQIFSMATGPQGPQGTAGANGANGTNGNTILYGTTVPSNTGTGQNGDFYLNTATYTLYGPKAAGVWPAGSSIIGAAGPAGASGAAGPGVPSGGTTGQLLAKIDAANYNTQWVPAPTGAVWGNISGTLSSQTDLNTALSAKAPLASPALTGNPTAPTQPGGDSSTKIATTAYVDKNFISFYGNIYNKTSWSNLADFTINGATVSVVGGALQFSGGAGTFTQTLELTTGSSAFSSLEKWKQTVLLIPTAITASSYGAGPAFRTVDAFGPQFGVYTQLELESGGNLGKLNMFAHFNDGNIASSSTGMPVTAGDTLEISLERDGTLMILSGRNKTQNSALISCSYQFDMTYGGSIYEVPNTGHFCVASYGGTINVVGWNIYSSELKNADILFVGDSKTIGYYSNNIDQRFASLIANSFNSNTVVLAGGNNTTGDVLNYLNEIIALRPKAVILCIGRNDIAFGVSTATWQTNLTTLRSSLISAGITVYLLLPLGEGSGFSDIAQAPLKAFYLGLDSSNCIDTMIETQVASVMLAPDFVHLSPTGEQWVADKIVGSGFFTTNSSSVNISNTPTFIGQTTLVSGTKVITLKGITLNSHAFVTLVNASGASSTITYQAVCTTDALTISANAATGTINTSDNSTINYQVFK